MQDPKSLLSSLSEKFKAIEENLDIPKMREEVTELEFESQKPGFWDDNLHASQTMQELNDLNSDLKELDEIRENLNTLNELVGEDGSGELDKEISALDKKIKKFEYKRYLSGKYDKKNAILAIHAGQGGTEAMDWVSMLYRMYMRYAEKKNWDFEVLDQTAGEEAGLKSVTVKVTGKDAYGLLKGEGGTHRLVRQSPFNADKLRQTSFALVEVYPEFEDVDLPDIEIKDDDLEWQFFRASSQGGQNVQKVSSAVRLTHKPTGIVVTAQTERYQEQNRKYALSLLRGKLWAKEQEEQAELKKGIQGEYTPATWGTQIRSYVLHPYKMIKDLRTQIETSDTDSVLDGNLDEFIEAELRLTKT